MGQGCSETVLFVVRTTSGYPSGYSKPDRMQTPFWAEVHSKTYPNSAVGSPYLDRIYCVENTSNETQPSGDAQMVMRGGVDLQVEPKSKAHTKPRLCLTVKKRPIELKPVTWSLFQLVHETYAA